VTKCAVSIVMAYYERDALLRNTLASFKSLGYGDDVEVIIVDDGSIREPLSVDPTAFAFRVKTIMIPSSGKRHINPCIPFNAGFAKAEANIVIIQNPECIHLKDIVRHARENCDEKSYLSYACYSLDEGTTKAITTEGWELVRTKFYLNQTAAGGDGQAGWYNHSSFKPTAYHFCSAITKSNLERLGGFDAKYANGIGFDDDELLYRIRTLPLDVKIIDGFPVLHQYHYSKRVYDKQLNRKMHANWVLFQFYTKHGRKPLRFAYYKLYMAFYSRGFGRIAKLIRRIHPGFSSSLSK